jgi:hypothetical protein
MEKTEKKITLTGSKAYRGSLLTWYPRFSIFKYGILIRLPEKPGG